MHVTGELEGANLTMDGTLTVTFSINEKAKAIDEINELKSMDKLTIDVKKWRNKKSEQANDYMWALLDKIAKHPQIRSTAWDMYIYYISKRGVWFDYDIPAEAYDAWRSRFRYTEVLQEYTAEPENIYEPGEARMKIRLFFGSSSYNSKELSDVIDLIVEDAKMLGIDTWTDDEKKAALAAWKGNGDGNSY